MYKNVMFWDNVSSYIVRLVNGNYDVERAVRAASLKYHLSETDIVKNCDLDVLIRSDKEN